MSHHHAKPSEYGVFYLPASDREKAEYKIVGTSWEDMSRLLGGGYIEVVRLQPQLAPALPCGCRMVMVVDEEGLLKGLPSNKRASWFYPFGQGIAGNAFLIGEGAVMADGYIEPDFVSLPPEFHRWAGAGHPYPKAEPIGS